MGYHVHSSVGLFFLLVLNVDPDTPMIQTDLSPFSSLLAVYEAQVTTPKRFNSVVVLFIEGE